MSAPLRRRAAWITTPVSGLIGRSSRQMARVRSVFECSSMSIRTNAPSTAAARMTRATVSRHTSREMSRPIWVSLRLTLRSRPRSASAPSVSSYRPAARPHSSADATDSPRTSTVVMKPAPRSRSSASSTSGSVSPATKRPTMGRVTGTLTANRPRDRRWDRPTKSERSARSGASWSMPFAVIGCLREIRRRRPPARHESTAPAAACDRGRPQAGQVVGGGSPARWRFSQARMRV